MQLVSRLHQLHGDVVANCTVDLFIGGVFYYIGLISCTLPAYEGIYHIIFLSPIDSNYHTVSSAREDMFSTDHQMTFAYGFALECAIRYHSWQA